jgi:hypothetical protein
MGAVMRKVVSRLLVVSGAWTFFTFSAFGAIIGSEDNRRSYVEFAKEHFDGDLNTLAKMFSAAGRVYCGREFASGSIVHDPDVMVTAAHVVYNEQEPTICRPKANLSQCYFEIINKDGSAGRRIAIRPETLRTPSKYSCGVSEWANDWAVVRLKDSVREVRPFVPINVDTVGNRSDNYRALVGSRVYNLSARSENFKNHPLSTATICEDSLGYVWPMTQKSAEIKYALGIGCPNGHGGSGGAILIERIGQVPLFLGHERASKKREFDYRPFDVHNFTGGPLLQGEFYKVLMGM